MVIAGACMVAEAIFAEANRRAVAACGGSDWLHENAL